MPDLTDPPSGAHFEGTVLAAKQERSRRTLDRLLDAAELALAEVGVEGATVPAIAGRAGMSVGVVYRRFRDKDALLRAVYERFFERTLAANAAALDPARWAGAPAERVVTTVVEGMVRGHVEHRGLLRALFTYAQAHADPAFRARVESLNAAAVARVAALLAARAAEIAHPEPQRAIALALAVVASTLYRWVQTDGGMPGLGADAPELARELARMVVGYLGIRVAP